MGRLGVQLESSLIILFAVQKTITIFAEKGGKSEICVVQSISVGESSFFLLYIECYPIIHSHSIDDDILSTQDFFGTSVTLDSVTDSTVIQCVPVGFVNGGTSDDCPRFPYLCPYRFFPWRTSGDSSCLLPSIVQ